METLGGDLPPDPGLLLATPYRVVDVTDADEVAAGVAWWEELTDARRRGDGRQAARLHPGPRPEAAGPAGGQVPRPRSTCGSSTARSTPCPSTSSGCASAAWPASAALAHREFALGVEGLERFVRREPLRRVHECVFGVLALESEPVDPRL